MPNRREFLLQTCSFCAAAAGLGFLATELDSCKSPEALKTEAPKAEAPVAVAPKVVAPKAPPIRAEVTKSQISLPASAFDTRKNYLVKDISLDFDVLVVKKPDNTYSALQMRCTHRGEPLRNTGTGLVCDAHGSEFDYSGNVTHAPASSPLKKYPATAENGKIIVRLDA